VNYTGGGDKSEKNQPQNIAESEKLLKTSWRNISLETLENLVSSMPNRLKDVNI